MTFKKRVHIFQGSLLASLREMMEKGDNSQVQLTALAVGTMLAMAINRADDEGAFDDDLSEVREAETAEG